MTIFRKSLFPLICATVLGATATSVLAGETNSLLPEGSYFYVRGDVGGSWQTSGSATWTTPGGVYQAMDLSNSNSLSGGVALGVQFLPMFRADLSYTFLGRFGLDACKPNNSGGCATSHNSATANTHLFMLNGYIQTPEPLAIGSVSVSPFVTAGLGAALNEMNNWNHIGTGAPAPGRDFYGASKWNFSWTVGAGAALDISAAVKRPAYLDLTYRYTDAGNAQGSSQPMPGSGNGIPVNAYSANIRTHSVFVGLRIPFGG